MIDDLAVLQADLAEVLRESERYVRPQTLKRLMAAIDKVNDLRWRLLRSENLDAPEAR